MSRQKIGIDIGKSAFKFSHDGETGKEKGKVGELPSWRANGTVKTLISNTDFESLSVRYDGIEYLLGKSALLGKNFSWPTDDKKDSLHNLVLLLGVLGKTGKHSADIIIGLPVAQMSDKKCINGIHQLFDGEKHAAINGVDFTFNIRTKVVHEPFGTYYSLVLDQHDDGTVGLKKDCPYLREHIAIVDVGYRTVDIVNMQGGKLGAIGDSTLSGTVDILEQAIQYLSSKYGMIKGNEKAKVYEAISQRSDGDFTVNGKEVEKRFWEEVIALKKQRARMIYEDTMNILAGIQPDKVVITGGGALLLKNELEAIDRRLILHPSPRYANAIGFYYFAKTDPWRKEDLIAGQA